MSFVTRNRLVVLASPDAALRGRLRASLSGMRWQVREASGGAEALAQMEEQTPEALLLDAWLPDLDVSAVSGEVRQSFPQVDLLRFDGTPEGAAGKSPFRHELLQALREATQAPLSDKPAWDVRGTAVSIERSGPALPSAAGQDRSLRGAAAGGKAAGSAVTGMGGITGSASTGSARAGVQAASAGRPPLRREPGCGSCLPFGEMVMGNSSQGGMKGAGSAVPPLGPRVVRVASGASGASQDAVTAGIPGLVGESAPMRELARLIRLVAPHNARVLIEGETGSGKELVAKALHTFSHRAAKPFVVLNCAAIPEALLEAELFGHTRGAFTGAAQARTGRIEAAHGGTLFLDEIGEMPLSLQSKLLRFLENGELQRVGENEPVRVDVRVIAATHQMLDERVEEGSFRLDLLHRLAVFPIEVPSLRERIEDVPLLAEHFLAQMAQEAPRKRLHGAALEKLEQHHWPGNVRELGHVLQRAAILAGTQPEITVAEILLRRAGR